MKKILITGANSYIGMTLEEYLSKWPERYQVETIDMVDGTWRKADFSEYDVVYHVAGIAHSDTGNVTEERKAFYYKINTDLTVETAEKAKADGVKQFIFMSSAIVYGDSAPIGASKMITKDTVPHPANFYGDSKLQAENKILPLQDNKFNVVILRPPMIYGKGSKGNYPLLAKMACKLPFFPKIENRRSMLYVGNLAEFVRLMIDNEEQGIFWPQNSAYVSTSQLVRMIALAHGKKIFLVGGFGWLLKLLSHITGMVNKAFGSFTYDMSLSEYKDEYMIFDFEKSIKITEN